MRTPQHVRFASWGHDSAIEANAYSVILLVLAVARYDNDRRPWLWLPGNAGSKIERVGDRMGNAQAEDELVILVHGTFSAPERGKLKWWQVGSPAWQEIAKRLPKGTRLAESHDVFYWSGENQERDRCQAGNDLLNRLLKLERQGRPYHLIGHSHGGSVIWHALQEAVRRRIGCKRCDTRLELPNLRSWATVGTPFLQYKESRMGRWPGAILSKLFFVISLLLTILLGLAAFQYIKNHVEFGDSFLMGLVVVATAAAIAAIPGLALHIWTSAIRREALAVRQSVMVRNHAMHEFGSRWLGVRSREDEAISGLKSSVKLRMQLLPRLQFRTNRVFQYDRRIWSYRFILRWLLAPLLNTTFIPYGNNMILATVSKSAQGDDRPGCTITSVSEGPICLQDPTCYPTLPSDVDEALIETANENLIRKAPELVPKVRTLLADYSTGVALLGGTIKDSGFEFVGNELVHTGYFDNGHVLDILTHHVGRHQQEPATSKIDQTLAEWYQVTREHVGQHVINVPQVVKRGLVSLAKKNRFACLSLLFGLAFPFGLIVALVLALGYSESAAYVVFGTAILTALLGVIFGRLGQLAAERGARFRRTATAGVNLGLLWLVVLPVIIVVLATLSFLLFESDERQETPPEYFAAISQAERDRIVSFSVETLTPAFGEVFASFFTGKVPPRGQIVLTMGSEMGGASSKTIEFPHDEHLALRFIEAIQKDILTNQQNNSALITY